MGCGVGASVGEFRTPKFGAGMGVHYRLLWTIADSNAPHPHSHPSKFDIRHSAFKFLVPYTLYLIPYTLYLIPYTLYLIPYTIYLIPYTFTPHFPGRLCRIRLSTAVE